LLLSVTLAGDSLWLMCPKLGSGCGFQLLNGSAMLAVMRR